MFSTASQGLSWFVWNQTKFNQKEAFLDGAISIIKTRCWFKFITRIFKEGI